MRYKEGNKSTNKVALLVSILLVIIIAIGTIVYINIDNTNKLNSERYNSLLTENRQTENKDIVENEIANSVTNIVANETTNTAVNEETGNATTNVDSTELFSKYYEKAEALMKTMTLEEKVGQMFLARYPESGVIEEIKNQNPGGYILFGRDFKNKTKSSMLKQLQNCQSNSKINLALGVDEEGGTVVRVSAYTAFRSSKFKSPQQLWKEGYLQKILDDSKEKSALLKSIGLNMNLTPVVDVPTSSKDFIYARSYGRGAEKTAEYTAALIKTMNADNMISTMKHFPGYGNNVDTHTGIAIDERKYETFLQSDFLPFKSGIEAGGPTILVNHNIVKCMDSTKPASLSENVHKILREDLKFSGIIMTDDLAMDAVKQYVEDGNAAVQAVIAGNDIIISSNFAEQKKEVVTAVKNGKISEETINIAVKRILAWKYTYGII